MRIIKNQKRKSKDNQQRVAKGKKGTRQYSVQEQIELLPFLFKTMNHSSRNSVKSILSRGQVTVDGKTETQYNLLLRKGQTVTIQGNKEALKKKALIGITILYEDEDILVIDKEAGILSMAAKDPQELTAYRQLTQYVKEENRNNRIFIVHRLDRDTSGVMLYAKSPTVKEILQQNWKERVKERIYTVLVEGTVTEKEGTISTWLTENKSMKVHSSPYDDGGKHAVTHYRRISGNSRYTLLEAELETGRKNQIRVHMQSIGHPVAGDRKYGATSNPLKRLGLHAATLSLLHPQTGKLIRFTSLTPEKFTSYVK